MKTFTEIGSRRIDITEYASFASQDPSIVKVGGRKVIGVQPGNF